MKVLDAGHLYELDSLDNGAPQTLTFVKREGDNYPGNVGHYGGVIIQEVLRALIDRCEYVNAQIPCDETTSAIECLRDAFHCFEARAARLHQREYKPSWLPERVPYCSGCGHIGCKGDCGRT